MRADGLTELMIVGQADGVERRQVQLDEAPPLLLGDVEATMHVDQVREPELAAEASRSAERFRGEGGQVIDVLGLSVANSGCNNGSRRTLV